MSLLKEFRDFIAQRNVIDLGVAFVMGAAFNSLVSALVTDIVTPLIGIAGHANVPEFTYTINGSTFLIGAFFNSLISFISIAIAVFFFIIKPTSKLRSFIEKPVVQTAIKTKKCPECLSSIPAKAKRCAFCTSKVS